MLITPSLIKIINQYKNHLYWPPHAPTPAPIDPAHIRCTTNNYSQQVREKQICSLHLLPFLITPSQMKNQNTKEIMDVLYVNEPTSRNFTQHFQYADQLITHQHQVEVSHVRIDDHLEIRNHFTVQNQAKLQKVTEIMLENRIIKIIDTFQSVQNPHANYRRQEISNQNPISMKKPFNSKKYTIFKANEEQDRQKLKDTKNVVKNIIRLFQCWLQENLPKYKQVYDELLTIVGKIKFNNHLIMRLVKDEAMRNAFLHFGLKDGVEFIDKSKIHDKKTHLEALQRYVDLFQSQSSQAKNAKEKVFQDEQMPAMVKQQ